MKVFLGVFTATGQSQTSLLKESVDSLCKQLEINVPEAGNVFLLWFCRVPNTEVLKESLENKRIEYSFCSFTGE